VKPSREPRGRALSWVRFLVLKDHQGDLSLAVPVSAPDQPGAPSRHVPEWWNICAAARILS
jgi:hypothetical protein